MSLDIEARLREYLASSPQVRHQVQTLEFSHSDLSQVFCFAREPVALSITTESGVRTTRPVNFAVKLAGNEPNLDQNFDIALDLTDADDEFREELDRIPLDTTERIRCVYREYLSDDLTVMVAGPAVLQVEAVSFQLGAASIAAVSPRLNVTSTGERYVPRDVPMLRSFI